MKNLRFLTLALVLISVPFITSCKKKGCLDSDAANYDSSAEKSSTCYFRYGYEVTVIAPSNVNYDPFDAPDLYIRFAKNASPQWDFITTVVDNSYFLTATFANEFLFTNEQWVFEVWDKDTFDSDDLVCSGSFNPLEDGSDGLIVVFNSGVEVRFKYSEKI